MFNSFLKAARYQHTDDIVAQLDTVRNNIPAGRVQTLGLTKAVFNMVDADLHYSGWWVEPQNWRGWNPLVKQLWDSVFDAHAPVQRQVGIYTRTGQGISVADAAPGGALNRQYPHAHSAITYLDLRDLATAAMDICRDSHNMEQAEGFYSILRKALPVLAHDARQPGKMNRAYYANEMPRTAPPAFDL